MPELFSIINCLRIYFPKNFSTFSSIVNALMCMSGSKTMLNISRYTNQKSCYNTIEKFYNRLIPWFEMNLMLIRKFLLGENTLLVLSSDETVVSK